MTKTALGMRPCQGERPCGGAWLVVLPRECLGRRAIRGHAGRKTEPHDGARRNADPLPEAHDRIEHHTGRAGEWPSIERLWTCSVSAAAEKAGAIGFPFDRPL